MTHAVGQSICTLLEALHAIHCHFVGKEGSGIGRESSDKCGSQAVEEGFGSTGFVQCLDNLTD